ncbi:hypothetical protein [Polyangium jinanense]|uniref:Acyl carrier protein n=1 Tax=Polyangium jinanense TaxID=2829994 RepID=A0A9X3XBU3_9BACT|nr:hypothetical protein [Polyangium jinanense]MDC3957713.1 hypothetical protein [Polyangium jinanense]MDC3987774.1 hypothetical protein [Polyangium jinanense]
MKPSEADILKIVQTVVGEIIEDWHLDVEITPETQLVADIGFTSMDFIDLFASIDTQLRRKIAYEPLLQTPGGNYRADITSGEIASFIWKNYDVEPAALKPA